MRIGQTIVPNAFIDNYLASANGEYVKVYLMLLRLADEEVTAERLADALEMTEADVMRALSYWEKQGIISTEGKSACAQRDGAETSFKGEAVVKNPASSKGAASAGASTRKSTKSPAQLAETDETFKTLVFVAEQYLARTLTKTDMELLSWLYDSDDFSSDLIEYLIEYCASMDKKSNRYIKTVALSWQSQGIKTVEQAKEQVKAFAGGSSKKTSGSAKHASLEQRDDDLNSLLAKGAKYGA